MRLYTIEQCSAINRLSIASTSTNFLSLVFVTQNLVLFTFGRTQKVLWPCLGACYQHAFKCCAMICATYCKIGGCCRPLGLENFQGKRKLLKIPENKKYIFTTVNLGHPLLFRASATCTKHLNVRRIFHTVNIFRATLFFRASASCSKILNDKK